MLQTSQRSQHPTAPESCIHAWGDDEYPGRLGALDAFASLESLEALDALGAFGCTSKKNGGVYVLLENKNLSQRAHTLLALVNKFGIHLQSFNYMPTMCDHESNIEEDCR